MLKKIKLSDIEKIDIVVETTTDNQIYAKYKPDYILNLSLYDVASGKNITHIKDNGKVSGYLFSDVGLGITNDNKPVWVKKDIAYKSNDIRDYCSFSPTLVIDGKKNINWGNKKSEYVNGNHYRSFCGFNDEYFFIGASDNRNTINALADYCVSQGMKYAGNNDGNGSVSLWEKGRPLKDSGRRNASWLLIYLKKDKPAIKGDDEVLVKETMQINDKDITVDTITKDGVTYMPLRQLAEMLGAEVTYDAVTKKKGIKIKK